MKERLIHEASFLSHKQHMASLIIDEAAIKPKCIYDRKSDVVFGIRDKPESGAPRTKNETLANRVLCFVLHGVASSYKIPCSYYFTKQLSGRDLYAWTKDVISAAEECGFVVIRIVTDNYSANRTMFKLMGNGSLSTIVKHPHDDERDIFLSFDPCHVFKNVRSQFLERELTDGTGVISGTFVQKLYEHQKDMSIKLARNLTRKHVYPSNLEKMNVLRAVQVFSPQVTAALEHLQQNSRVSSLLSTFRDATSTINFMKVMKKWFDIHDTTYNGSGCKMPISREDDDRLLWLQNEFCSYVKTIQECSIATGVGNFTEETYSALLFSTKSTVEVTRFLLRKGVSYVLTRKFNSDPIEALFGQLRFMCGGNDALDARAVTTALDHIVKKKALPSKGVAVQDEDAEEAAASVPQDVVEELKALKAHLSAPPASVAYSGLVYVGGYLAKLVSDLGCHACVMLVTTNKTSSPLYKLLSAQENCELHYPKPEFLALLETISTFFEKAVKTLPRSKILEALQLIVEPHLEDSPLLSCPEGVDRSHAKRLAHLISEKFLRILLVNYTKKLTDQNDKPSGFTHKPTRKHFRL
ncbi:hypothetical protein HPB47_000533 [Ixodes persulcatus]|uniref:Uncharacterized protein n=1 Tax=Ixodes persulcatus TaxID=34615 RepID=A0AC60PRF7_IXOPE|nr:hypothetical protein HPB47_000533 [Ixodes persulcatus]